MCGIIGYIGNKEADKILVSGLEKLEYRGYDSAGLSVINKDPVTNNSQITIFKTKGRVASLQSINLPGKIGIGHTRWATHGLPSDKNSHPFTDQKKQFALVHNGIIENYLELKEELRESGVQFSSDTDSEVIVHFISKYYQENLVSSISTNSLDNNFKTAVIKTIQKLQGAYAFCVIKNDSEEIIGARNGSPLVIGLGEEENFFASDISAVVEHTKNVVYINDFEIAKIKRDNVEIFDFNGMKKEFTIKKIDWDLEQAQKSGYKHFMLKEIMEQPKVIEDSLGLKFNLEKPKRIIIVACGTASYAGLVGKYLIEKIARIQVINETASEFRYKDPLIDENDLIIAISQSGETADTLAAVRLAKQKGAKTFGLINVIDSTIAREVDNVVYTRAGPEIGVASTKAFTSQLISMYLLAHHLAGKIFDHDGIIEKIQEVLKLNDSIKELSKKYYNYSNFLYIGRNTSFPLALEGALKLKEISYIHAEAYPAGELKHGPIALVSEETPTFAICPQDEVYDKTLSNIEEIKARNGKVIVIATEGDEKVKQICDDVIFVPKVDTMLYPLLCTIPLQLFAYHIADRRECDIDKPRNLAKSVTVE
ncbi:MAG: glutamine--fructose-6-phosphate transaminase (isomerizing) [Candidatus Woesearchaeota archaeon]